MEKIMVGAATGVMNSLLRKLTTMMEKEYILLTGVERDIALLKEELLSMNLFLFKLANIEDLDVQAKDWRDRVRELSYDIEDCIDHIMHNDSPEAKGGLVCKVANKIRKLWSHHEIGKQIQELRTRVMEESTRRDRYSLDDSFARPRAAETDHRLTALFVEANKLEGIDRPMEQIMQWLTAKGESDQGLKFISIVGFGGLGKTTLAIQAYNKVRDHFDCAAFVSVSRNPSIRKVLMDLLKDVGADIDTTDDEGRLINNIRGYLNKKR
jgi:plasmid stabilization system protein ParE